ncbi:MAG: ribonuclease HII [Candidatus Wildermuthbacteria bacterium]|nr:ribonuclease HII [Candidatus Wildermuthbacteria bacterium]
MRYSTLKEEIKLWKSGYRLVAGIDEVGRGPLAGPVVACACVILGLAKFDSNLAKPRMPKLRDSKQLSEKQREGFYKVLVNHPNIAWGVGRVYPGVIDKINIFQATKLAMVRALRSLEKKLNKEVEHVILDGNMTLDVVVSQTAMVKADEKVFSCAAASIIAKVKRDRLMKRYHKKFVLYGFDKHKGYGTKLHVAALKEHGPCDIHRRSFAPVLA